MKDRGKMVFDLLLLSLAKFLHASSQDVTNVDRTILPHGDVVSPKQLTVVVSKGSPLLKDVALKV
jgi:hypothetical protein